MALSVALTAATLLFAGLDPAGASQCNVEFDDETANLVILAFERESANSRLIEDILDTRGYSLLCEHVALEHGREAVAVRTELGKALEAALAGQGDPGFGFQRVRARPAAYRATLAEFRRVAGTIRWRITDRLNGFLPPRSSFDAKAHIIVGGGVAGLAFSDREDIALRLDDFVSPHDGGAIDVERLASVLTHELFHVGFRAAGGQTPEPAWPDGVWQSLAQKYGRTTVGEVWRASHDELWDGAGIAARIQAWVAPPEWDPLALDRYLAMLSRLQNEGSAVYVDAPMRSSASGPHSGEIERWMSSINQDFAHLAGITDRLSHGAGPEEIDRLAAKGFEKDGPLYRVGYRIAERIDNFAGRQPFLDAIPGGPLAFFETYFATHPYGPGQIDTRTQDEIERIIEAFHAMGQFDPES
ncbi:MAG: DUF5700 domain-containing putative Zn-dependent protease [Candidatus Eiseniibacteriota bacterium]